MQIPWASRGRRWTTTSPGVPQHLKLTGQIVAQMYLGKITRWDDPAIAKLNPRVNLPEPEDDAGVALGRVGNDVQLHRLPVARCTPPGTRGSVRRRRSTGRPASEATVTRGSQVSVPNQPVGSHTPTSPTRSRARSSRHRCRTPPESSCTRTGRNIPAAANTREVGPGEQRDAHRQPGEHGNPRRTRSARSRT